MSVIMSQRKSPVQKESAYLFMKIEKENMSCHILNYLSSSLLDLFKSQV